MLFIRFAFAAQTGAAPAAATFFSLLYGPDHSKANDNRDNGYKDDIDRVHIYIIPHAAHTSRTANAAAHATAHCHITTPAAHLKPSSRLMAAIEATHGV